VPTPDQEAESTPNPPRITALVVSHNRVALLRRVVQALELSQGREQIEILVVDNGSTDGSAQLESEFPGTRFIRVPRNFGLTKAINIGVRSAAGEFIFLLHDDVEVSPETASALAGVLETDTDVGAVCPLLVKPDGSPAPQVAPLPAPGVHEVAWRAAELGAGRQTVEYARGGAIMLRSFLLRALRHIDERYGQSGSDAELCFQVRQVGKKIVVLGAARATDLGVPSTNSNARALRRADCELGLSVYLSKHYGFAAGLSARITASLRALGALLSFGDFGYNFALLRNTLSGQKIDGTQRDPL
jgi:GT2 family glycosyltransferase